MQSLESSRRVSSPADVPGWRPSLLWRAALVAARLLVPLVCRLQVTGDVPARLRGRGLILASNHVGNFDPVALTAACRTRRLAPRMMATGAVFTVPVIGAFMRACGHIPVNRATPSVTDAAHAGEAALREGSVVGVYPEGRIGLAADLWPERAKTGPARMALSTGAAVVPVATWGGHEVIAYHGRWVMLWTLLTSVVRRPVVKVHFGEPVDLSGLDATTAGQARHASDRILDAITAHLAVLRADEPRLPRYVDLTRPVSAARSRRRPATDPHGR